MHTINFKFQDWKNKGKRIPYDFQKKRLLPNKHISSNKDIHYVFQQIVNHSENKNNWITMLPGYPDGSFGWARVEYLLKDTEDTPRLYVEYIGQGDSDKPEKYNYSTIERADLVEANWIAQKIKSTFVVTFDYSSLVVLELLRRQQERISNGETPITNINKVLIINGGFFADSHSHPFITTPLLKTSIGKMSTRMVQKSKTMFSLYIKMMKNMWSKEYGVSKKEMDELYEVITHRNGAVFMSNAAGFVDEHQKYTERWNLLNIYLEMKDSVSFHIIGSEKDPFEPNQVINAKKRLGKYGVDIRLIPGGHMSTSEHPELLANIIKELN